MDLPDAPDRAPVVSDGDGPTMPAPLLDRRHPGRLAARRRGTQRSRSDLGRAILQGRWGTAPA
jgi:hypothetical protein